MCFRFLWKFDISSAFMALLDTTLLLLHIESMENISISHKYYTSSQLKNFVTVILFKFTFRVELH